MALYRIADFIIEINTSEELYIKDRFKLAPPCGIYYLIFRSMLQRMTLRCSARVYASYARRNISNA